MTSNIKKPIKDIIYLENLEPEKSIYGLKPISCLSIYGNDNKRRFYRLDPDNVLLNFPDHIIYTRDPIERNDMIIDVDDTKFIPLIIHELQKQKKNTDKIKLQDNKIILNKNYDQYIGIDRDTGATGATGSIEPIISTESGKVLTLQSGSAPLGSTNIPGGDLVLRVGQPTGLGNGNTGTSIQGIIKTDVPLLKTSGSIDAPFLTTKMSLPGRLVPNNGQIDIIKLNFTRGIKTACSFNIFVNIIDTDTPSALNTSRAISMNQLANNTINTFDGVIFSNIPNNGPISTNWSIQTDRLNNTATIRLKLTGLSTVANSCSYTVSIDNMIYDPQVASYELPKN
jgi:hypothetical protein